MTDIKLQKISTDAWIVKSRDQKLGLLNLTAQNRYTYLDSDSVMEFNTRQDLEQYLGTGRLTESRDIVNISEPADVYIKGYPVDYANPIPVYTDDPDYRADLPLFRKTQNSDITYCAGWYAVGFDRGWKAGMCPKLSTILKYGYQGPFADKATAKAKTRALNRKPDASGP